MKFLCIFIILMYVYSNPDIGVIILGGGVGKRMKSEIPKQIMLINNKPIIYYSYELFKNITNNIVIVLDEKYRYIFNNNNIIYAQPGNERQDSVYNGILKLPKNIKYIIIHDSARPYVNKIDIYNVIQDGIKYGAAILANPVKYTIKQSDDGQFVNKTMERETLWEAHTPQVVKKEWLIKGYKKAKKNKKNMTDDSSFIELLDIPVKITLSTDINIKITNFDDFEYVSKLIKKK
eukprot:GHVL01007121.1.p1 GENE.GHVL01007121.1~~GHVL01007121.1.p1  ORF type:complete len:234 (-),score=71.48 GHVL01007121.1:68-769(-)